MKKTLSSIFFYAVICTATFAQTNGEPYAGFHFGFVYPLSTNGTGARYYTNGASLNLLAGVSKNEKAAALSGLTNIVLHDATGVQAAGLYNHVNNQGRGLLLSGLAGFVRHDYTGVQAAGLANVAGNVTGLQLTGLLSVAGNVNGLQAAGLISTAGNVSGLQLAGLLNAAGNVSGPQVAGVLNAAGNVGGPQLAGVLNAAGSVGGSQVAGLVNVAGNVSGLQVAALLNVAGESDYPIGLVNLVRNGEKSLALTYSEIGSLALSFRSGGRVTYGIVGCGYSLNGGKRRFLSEGGLGAHINLSKRLRLNNEILFETHYSSDHTIFKTGYHLLAACRIASHMEVFAGPGVNFMYSDDPEGFGVFPRHSLWKRQDDGIRRQLFAGCQLGVQYIF